MEADGKATRIALFDLSTPNMRAFHMAWIAFFLCFFAWFGVAPLMAVVRGELQLTKDQIGWCIIGSVAVTVFARLLAGWMCDRIGPRLTYAWLLILGSIPVMAIGLAHDFATFLLFRVMIGAIGASFVITQYHTSRMFAPNCVGTANATAAGWGNLGGGVTQLAMPLLFATLVGWGLTEAVSWRVAMVAVGMLCALTGVAYYFFTQDTPEGNFRELRAAGKMPRVQATKGAFGEAARDRRVWALFLIYGACFGMELTIDNIAVLYFIDYFDYFKTLEQAEALRTAGMIAAMFGGMNLFARIDRRSLRQSLGARRAGEVAVHRPVRRGDWADALLASDDTAAGDTADDHVRDVREDVERRHLRGRAVPQSAGARRCERHRRRRRELGGGGVRLFAEDRGARLALGPVHRGDRGDMHFVRELCDHVPGRSGSATVARPAFGRTGARIDRAVT